MAINRTSSDRPIATIHELVRELLRHPTPSGYGAILARYAVPGTDIAPYFRWNEQHYTRTCILRNRDFELLVVCYAAGQRTSIHDYDSELAWIHPIAGRTVEERFTLRPDGGLQLAKETSLRPGDQGSITRRNSIHRFSNPGPERAITLNLYARPMSQWRVYDERSGTAQLQPAGANGLGTDPAMRT